MTRAPNWLFSYGTLRLPEVQRATFGRLLDGEDDALPGFAVGSITLTDPTVIALSAAAVHPILRRSADLGAAVAGTALAVTDDELLAADAYEPAEYERVAVTLASGRRAFVYVERA